LGAVDSEVAILKTLWGRRPDGVWSIDDLKGLTLKPRAGFAPDFFQFESEVELMTSTPGGKNFHEVLASFGTTDFLLKQSILPVLAWAKGATSIRCIGTAFVVSCTGLVITAGHVLLDPQESGYGGVIREGSTLRFSGDLNMGVLVPLNPAYGRTAFLFLPFELSWYWGEWQDSPLFHRKDEFKFLTDIALCKIPALPNGVPHQPLNLSLRRFKPGEEAFAIGYAEMPDIPITVRDGRPAIAAFEPDLYVSVGAVMEVFPENHLRKDVPAPGPCFDFRARIPGKMSGAPIFGGDGAVVRGVVSRSFSGEKHAYGAMLGPAMHLPLGEDKTLKSIMDKGNEGIPKVQAPDL
jgi:hypothetical protein